MEGRRISVSPWVEVDAKGNEVVYQIPPEIRVNARHVFIWCDKSNTYIPWLSNDAAASRNPGPSGGAQ